MSNAPLPNQIDVRKLAVKNVEISAVTPVSSLPRFVDMLADGDSSIAVNLHFYIDDERIRRVDGQITATVNVFCQRCLDTMPLELDTQFQLGIVWSEEDAKRLPGFMEPLIVGEELVDLADIVSEELILSMPYVSYHAPEDCKQVSNYSTGEVAVESSMQTEAEEKRSSPSRDNPFSVLQQLKRDK